MGVIADFINKALSNSLEKGYQAGINAIVDLNLALVTGQKNKPDFSQYSDPGQLTIGGPDNKPVWDRSYTETDIKALRNFKIEAFTVAKIGEYDLQEKLKSLAITIIKEDKGDLGAFKSIAQEIAGKFIRGDWLQTNITTATASAYRGAEWIRLNDPYVNSLYSAYKYKTRQDSHVRDEHRELNNKVFHKVDPAWEYIWPPNGWNCRCYVIPIAKDETEELSKREPITGSEEDLKKIIREAFPKKRDFKEFGRNSGMVNSIWGKWIETKFTDMSPGIVRQIRQDVNEYAKEIGQDPFTYVPRMEYPGPETPPQAPPLAPPVAPVTPPIAPATQTKPKKQTKPKTKAPPVAPKVTKPKPKTEPKPKTVPPDTDNIQLKQYTTKDQIQADMGKVIHKHTGITVTNPSLHPEISLEKASAIIKAVDKMLSEYDVKQWRNTESGHGVKFKMESDRGTYGFVRSYGGIVDTFNVGHRTDPGDGVYMLGRTSIRGNPARAEGRGYYVPKSQVDPENLDISTAVHETAHFISASHTYRDPRSVSYFAELKKIKTKYTREMNKAIRTGDQTKRNDWMRENYLGDYASTKLDEFHAEAITEYKLRTNPSPYAKIVGELFDKYFKKTKEN